MKERVLAVVRGPDGQIAAPGDTALGRFPQQLRIGMFGESQRDSAVSQTASPVQCRETTEEQDPLACIQKMPQLRQPFVVHCSDALRSRHPFLSGPDVSMVSDCVAPDQKILNAVVVERFEEIAEVGA